MMIRQIRLPVPIAVVSTFYGLNTPVVTLWYFAATLSALGWLLCHSRSMQLPLDSFDGYGVLETGVHLLGYLRQCSLTI